MTWRVQWRASTPKGTPSTIKHEDLPLEDAKWKVMSLLANQPHPCWINVEDLESTHKGSSSELERKRAAAAAKVR